MLRKYTLIASVLVIFGMPVNARAQTTLDISMKIQAILDQFSEIRSGLKQIQSSMNIETMLQNLGGGGDWKEMLKNAAGGIFDRNAEKGGTKQAFLVVPEELADKTDDPDAVKKWLEKNMYAAADATVAEVDEIVRKRSEFQYTALLSGYGKVVSLRKQLDKDIETIDQLKQDAESKDSETDLQNEINKLALLKLEQTNYQQLLEATQSHIDGTYAIVPTNRSKTEQ
ncbi:MAG: hypothetical protein IJ846_01615 [Alphaproteobacteria bacterium]|nr:hypothetical protein [Alphaproteobacteria bacterium]